MEWIGYQLIQKITAEFIDELQSTFLWYNFSQGKRKPVYICIFITSNIWTHFKVQRVTFCDFRQSSISTNWVHFGHAGRWVYSLNCWARMWKLWWMGVWHIWQTIEADFVILGNLVSQWVSFILDNSVLNSLPVQEDEFIHWVWDGELHTCILIYSDTNLSLTVNVP